MKPGSLGVTCAYAQLLAALREVLPLVAPNVAEHVRLFVVDRAAPLYLLQRGYRGVFREAVAGAAEGPREAR